MDNQQKAALWLLLDTCKREESDDSDSEMIFMVDNSRKRKRSKVMRRSRSQWTEDDLLQVWSEDTLREFIRFDLTEFRELLNILQIPEIVKYNGSHQAPSRLCLAIVLRRLSCNLRNLDIGREVNLQGNLVGSVYTETIKGIFWAQAQKLRSLRHKWINRHNVEEWAEAIHENGFPLRNIAGFVDGKCLCCCRPAEEQDQNYCGHHHRHAIKFLMIGFPNGILLPYGPFKGCTADGGCVQEIGLDGQLLEFLTFGNTSYSLLADKAFATTDQIIAMFKMNMTPAKRAYNKKHSKERCNIEYGIGTISNSFRRFMFDGSLRLLQSPVALEYIVAVHCSNIKTIMRGYNRVIASYPTVNTPTLEEYMESLLS